MELTPVTALYVKPPNAAACGHVLAGQVARVLSSHPGPPGIGLYPLLKTSTGSEPVMLSSFGRIPHLLPGGAGKGPDRGGQGVTSVERLGRLAFDLILQRPPSRM
jgi:hypothetical protein